MAEDFSYRPKFVDIRVTKRGRTSAPKAAKEAANKTPCDYTGCEKAGDHKAPKGRDRPNEFWHFCMEHVTDYNKRWNYFAGMSDAELRDYRAKEEVGHRPTWTFKGGKGDRLAAAARGFKKGDRPADPFGMFTDGVDPRKDKAEPRRLSKLQAIALEVMQLPEAASAADIRAKYAELVKRWHPDSNGGDRGAEANLQKVVQAYQQLKRGGLV